MSGCSGLHCAGCGGGVSAPVVTLLGICGADWVLDHIVEVAVVSGACGTVALGAVIWLMRLAERRDAVRMAVWRAERWAELPAAERAAMPQAERPAAIENHYHVHHHYAGPEPARATAIPGQAGDAITEGK